MVLKQYSIIFLFALILQSAAFCTNIFSAGERFDADSSVVRTSVILPDSLQSDSLVIQPDSLTSDSLKQAMDSLRAKIESEKVYPIHQLGLSISDPYASVMKKEEIYRYDYRYAGDIFSYVPSGFVQDLGSFGQPNETNMFGLGYGSITYLKNGQQLNNKIFNSFDLNHFQSESIDSLEIIPLPRGFLYGTSNNPVSINFVSKDWIPEKPYTRIRFYQAPDDEGVVDGQFNAVLRKNLIGFFEFTNNSVESRFDNSEYGAWKINTHLKYLLSNSFNIIGGYSYLKSNVHLNGGVNIDTLRNTLEPGQVDEQIYNNLSAPVYYESRYRKDTQHGFNLRLLGKFGESFISDLQFYYQFSLTEFRQNEYNDAFNLAEIPSIVHNNKYRTFGGSFKQNFRYGFINLETGANYEKSEIISPLFDSSFSFNALSAWGRASLDFFDGLLIPSAYTKFLNYNDQSYPGFGADVSLSPVKWLTIFGGASIFNKTNSPFSLSNTFNKADISKAEVKTIEAGIKFTHPNLMGKISYYRTDNDRSLIPIINYYSDSLRINEVGFYDAARVITKGLSANLNFHYWKFMLSGNANYFNIDYPGVENTLPKFTLFAGIYYVDILFDDNLNLKTGFNFRLFGSQNFAVYDFEKSAKAYYSYDPANQSLSLLRNEQTSTSYQVDFYLNGIIQEAAIVYFVFENILGNDYYIFPYYPKQGRGLRFGLSWELFN